MVDKKESIRRLTILRDFLKNNVKEETLRMNQWECGTTKCALGWACYIPEFEDLGLSMKRGESGMYPAFSDYMGYSAGMLFFGLLGAQSRFIFDPVFYVGVSDLWEKDEVLPITMGDVIRHIDEVIKQQEMKK